MLEATATTPRSDGRRRQLGRTPPRQRHSQLRHAGI